MLSWIGRRSENIELWCLSTSLKPQSKTDKLCWKTAWFSPGSGKKGTGHRLTWISIFSFRPRSSWAWLSRSSGSSSCRDPRLDFITLWDCSACSFWKDQGAVSFRWISNHDVVFYTRSSVRRAHLTPTTKPQPELTRYLHACKHSHKFTLPFTSVLLRAQP